MNDLSHRNSERIVFTVSILIHYDDYDDDYDDGKKTKRKITENGKALAAYDSGPILPPGPHRGRSNENHQIGEGGEINLTWFHCTVPPCTA